MKRDRNDTSNAAISVFFIGANFVHSLKEKASESYEVNGTVLPFKSVAFSYRPSFASPKVKLGPRFTGRMRRKFGNKYFAISDNRVCVFIFDPTDLESFERIRHELGCRNNYFRYSDFDVQMLVSCTSADLDSGKLKVTPEEIGKLIAEVRISNPKFELECQAVNLSDEASVNKFFERLVTSYLGNTISTLGSNIISVEEGRRQLGFLAARYCLHKNEARLLSRNASSNRHSGGRLVNVSEKSLNEFLAVVKGICCAGPLTELILVEINRVILVIENLRKAGMHRDMALQWQSIWKEINEAVVDNLDKKVADPNVMHCAQQSEFIEDYYTIQTKFSGLWVNIKKEKKYVDKCERLRTKGLPQKAALKKELEHLGEWRLWKHSRFPAPYRAAMRTLGLLAKASVRDSKSKPATAEGESCSLQ